jgi:CBS domain-containing protein
MKLGDILALKGSGTITVVSKSSVGDAIRVMSQKRVGSVLVADDGETPEGIFTERDVLNLMADQGQGAVEVRVAEVMTRDLLTATPATTVDETLAMITARRCRHIPVLEDGRLVGMVSIGDLVKAKLEEAEHEVESLREYIHTGY